MSIKIINYLTKLISENCNDENFVSAWADQDKDEQLKQKQNVEDLDKDMLNDMMKRHGAMPIVTPTPKVNN